MAVCLTYLQTSITTPITASYINLLIAGSSDQFMTVYQTQQCPMVQFETITKVHVPNTSNTLF